MRLNAVTVLTTLFTVMALFPAPGQSQNCQVCALALDPQASRAFAAGNGAQVSLNDCGIRVNSTSTSAFYATGGAKVNASSIEVVGGSNVGNGAMAAPTPQTGAPAALDPFAGTAVPTVGSCLSHPDYTSWGQNGQYTLSPGTYCNGLAIANGVTAQLNPGVYVINGGGLQLGSGTVAGTGVTFYITGSSFTNNQLVSINNGMNVNLAAPTSGGYAGILFFQDPTINNSALSSNFGGGATMNLTGSLYFPTTSVAFSNGANSTANSVIIARTVDFQGGAGIRLNSSAPVLPPVSVTVSPSSAPLYANQTQQFSASVAAGCSSAVTWSISPSTAGSINSSGLYTAPSTITTLETVTVMATSQSDNTKTASATITLYPPETVTVSPSTGTLYGGQTQQFTASVANAQNTSVTWTIMPATGAGTIIASGLYTAPATVTSSQMVTVTATSAANTSVTGTATITLLAPTYSNQRAIVIDHTKVPNTDQSNFPVLISGTFPDLATASNGGQVQSANGYDIIFTSDCAATVKLDHEIESYNPLTGAITMWVRIPALSHTTDSVIYLNYGNAGVTTSQENRTGVWDANYLAVYHLNAVASGGLVLDSTANAQNLTNFGGTAVPGVIGGAFNYNGSSYSALDGANVPQGASTRTLETWVQTSSSQVNASSGGEFVGYGDNNNHRFALADGGGTAGLETESASLAVPFSPDGNWHQFVAALPSGSTEANALLYKDGAVQSPKVVNGGFTINTNNTELSLGRIPTVNFTGYYIGSLDEVRISNIARSSDWIATEYANQSSPSTFFTVLPANTINVLVEPSSTSLTGGQTQQFVSVVTGSCDNTNVTWSVPANQGMITAGGLYIAPATITSAQTVTVTAMSAANNAVAETASVNLIPLATNSVSPATATLTQGQTLQFTATINNPNQAVTWSVLPLGMGTISATGLYTAPPSIYALQPVTITATSVANPALAPTAAISLVPAASVSISPAAAALGPSESLQLNANVVGPFNTAVTWTLSGPGSITQAGVYIAPPAITTASSATITAISLANPTVSVTAIISLVRPSPLITVTVRPATAAVTSGQTQQFAAAVAGASNTSVTWTIVPNVGKISAGGLYTAPANLTGSQTVTVIASSAADPADYGSASAVVAPPPVSPYSYRRPIVINHTQMAGADETSFPVMITGTFPYLAAAPNGKVEAPNNYDIIFTSDCAGLQQLNYEITSYVPSTGAATMWVLLPQVSHTTDTVFYISYGDPSVVTSQQNSAPVEAARNASGHSSAWLAAAASNQNSPSTFYTIYPENANSLAPSGGTLSAGQMQQYTPLYLVSAAASRSMPLTLIGSLPTPSTAQAVAVDGNTVYVCDNNEISVIDITNPASPIFLAARLASAVNNSGDIHCSVQRNNLAIFADGVNSATDGGRGPAFLAFSLSNPQQPQLIGSGSSPIGARYVQDPAYSGNIAYVPSAYQQLGPGSNIYGAYGQLWAIDTTNFASPQTLSVLLGNPPNPGNGIGPQTGFVSGSTVVNSNTLYAVGSNDPENWAHWNIGQGRLDVVNISNPSAISLVKEVDVPGTVELYNIGIQGNTAVAIGNNGGIDGINGAGFVGNITITTFDITNPQSPAILKTVATSYGTVSGQTQNIGGWAQIATNLFVFGGVIDTNGKNAILQVDISDPLNPVPTTVDVPTQVTNMVVSGNILHTSNGSGGYAAYQIPGVSATNYALTGNCAGPSSWGMSPSGVGTLTSTGLYTAPATVSSLQTVTIAANNVNDPTQAAEADLTLSPVLTITLSSSRTGPYITGNGLALQAAVTTAGTPVSGQSVTLTVTGANPGTFTAITNSSGIASFSYTGAIRGPDSILAAADGYSSSGLTVNWITPANPITTTEVNGQFYTASSCASGCEAFTTTSSQVPVFVENFPDLLFDPFSSMPPSNSTGIGSTTRPFTDIAIDNTGAPTGTTVAQGNGSQAGAGSMLGFSAVLRGSFVVTQAGNYTLNVGSADGFILGVSGGATRVSGVTTNPPASGTTAIAQYPVLAANNGPSTGAATPIVIAFPAPGAYPYEFDYKSGTGGALSLAVAVPQGSSAIGLPPLIPLVLTQTSSANPRTGQQATFSVLAKDETGAPAANLAITFAVSGANPQNLTVNTNSSGIATFSYTGHAAGADLAQATAIFNGQAAISNQTPLTWTAANAPLITVSGTATLQLPSTGSYTATITDPSNGAGGAITMAWTEVSGPGTVSFDKPSQTTTDALFTAPGLYVLQITASDSLGSSALQITVTVNPPVNTEQGWIASPIDHSLVTGLVPITLIASENLVSGTLSYYPLMNPSKVTTLNANATTAGGGTIATLDTTLLANGSYYIVLNATDTTGKTMGSGVVVIVGGSYKPGRVTTTVTDLVVPAPGLPIQISRTYDSLVRGTSGDFGYGWNLSINLQMQIAPTNDITFTINGQQKTFYFTPTSSLGVLYTPAYTAEPGFFGTLTSPASNCGTGISNQIIKTGSVYLCAIGFAPYAPSTLIYTDPYGRQYTVGGTGALQQVKDVAGNTLTVTPTGISASNQLSVPFVRDTQGRITQITDPLGNIYSYAYDTNGNLASVTYPGITTPANYTYDPTHLYTGGTDPRGNPLPSTTYDSDGRLLSVTDALGETTSYGYNVSGNTTTVTYPPDANGIVGKATMVYDSYGMLLSSTDPLLLTTTNTYDANHNLLSVTDPLGHTTSYTYDSNGNRTSKTYPKTPTSGNTTSSTQYNAYGEPTQTTDELANVRTFSYDANFWPKLATDRIGPVVSFTFNPNGTQAAKAVGYDLTQTSGTATIYTYDQYGNMISQTDALGRNTTYTYDTLGRLHTTTTPAGGTTTNIYDFLGNLTAVAAPLGRKLAYTYDANNNKASSTDGDQHTTTYSYDALNRLSHTTYPDTTSMSYTYDFRNNVINTTDQAGRVTHNTYDLSGRPTSTTMAYGTPQEATTSYTYYNDGRKATQTDPNGNKTTYNYDPAGRLISTVDAQGNTTAYTYDDAGNQTQVSDPNGHKTQSQYDARRRLTKITYPDGTTTLYAYDGPGNLTATTDQASNTVQYTYDLANQLRSVVQTASPNPQNTTSYAYDANGNLNMLTDANAHITQNGFDLLNQLQQETLPVGQMQTRTYDAQGNLTKLTDYNGKTTTYTYDSLNRLLSRTPDPSLTDAPETFTYTLAGKRATMTDASGTTTYAYDSLDRLITKSTPQGTLTYTYDAAGNVASMQSSNANGASVGYTYDNLNRLASVVDNRLPTGQNTTTYTYDPASNLRTMTYPNGLSSTFTYDTLNRMTDMNSYHYKLGPTGNRASAMEPSGRTLNWSYDGIYRLTNETISLDPHSNNGSVNYGLDPVANRLSQQSTLSAIASIPSLSYDANDRLATEIYDNNGDTQVSGARTFVYDFENRLKSMTMGGSTVTIVYDGDGNRAAKTASGVTTKYLVDELSPTGYAQVVEDVAGSGVQRTYTYGLQRVAQNQLINGVWTPSFYGYDGFGSVRTLTDSAGKVTDTYDHDAWGNAANITGSTPNLYLYRGEQFDPDLRLYYLRARYFNPLSGRFLTPDPETGHIKVPASLHKYNYAASDPVNYADSSGRDYFNWRFRPVIIGPFYTAAQWIAKDEAAIRECIAAVFEAALAGIGTFQAAQCWGVN